jgi:hypothetical protein
VIVNNLHPLTVTLMTAMTGYCDILPSSALII